jgi:hypothetical protein
MPIYFDCIIMFDEFNPVLCWLLFTHQRSLFYSYPLGRVPDHGMERLGRWLFE